MRPYHYLTYQAADIVLLCVLVDVILSKAWGIEGAIG